MIAVLMAAALMGAGPAHAADIEHAPDRVAAVQAAADQGSRVWIESEQSETTRVWAEPEGGFTTHTYPGPEFVHQADGSWQEIDTTLHVEGGSLVPATAAADINLANGSAGQPNATLATVAVSADSQQVAAGASTVKSASNVEKVPAAEDVTGTQLSVSLGWNAPLPTPSVAGNIATYANVAPGQDLRVEVKPQGIETYLDLKARPTSVPSDGITVSMPLSAKGLAVVDDNAGGFLLKDAAGNIVSDAPKAQIWDGAIDPASGDPMHAIAVAAKVVKSGTGWILSAKVPQSFLTNPDVSYPVTVDPVSTIYASSDADMGKFYAGSNYGSNDELRVGTYDGGTHVGRTLLNFPTPDLQGSALVSARLNMFETASASCTPSVMNVTRVTSAWSASTVTWNTQPTTEATPYGSINAARGFGSPCDDGVLTSSTGSVGVDVTPLVQKWVTASPVTPNQGMELLAANETDSNSWKVFFSSEHSTAPQRPYLSITTTTGAPTVSSSLYLLNGSVEYYSDPLTTNFAFPSADSSVTSYRYTQDGGSVQTQTDPTLAWYPNPGQHTLTAWAVSSAGIQSAPATFTFTVTAPGTPPVPTSLKSGATDTPTPVLAGVSSTPTGGLVRSQFFLANSSGAPVGDTPYLEATKNSGDRVVMKIPDGALQSGQTYRWSMAACASTGCSPRTADQTFVYQPVTPTANATQSAAITAPQISSVNVNTVAGACGGAMCSASAGPVKIGFDGTKRWRSYLSFNTSAIPAGSVVTSAKLSLSPPSQSVGYGPLSVEVRAMQGAWTPTSTSDILTSAVLDGDAADTQSLSPGVGPTFDISSNVASWLQEPTMNLGLELRVSNEADTNAMTLAATGALPAVAVTYVPPGAPGVPTAMSATAGDGAAVATFAAPQHSGYAGEVTDYQATAYNAAGSVISQATTKNLSAMLTGLTNGTPYTVKIISRTPYGQSVEASAAVTPAASPVAAAVLTEAAQQFAQARADINYGVKRDAASALPGLTRAAMISNLLTAYAPNLITTRGITARHTENEDIGFATNVQVASSVAVPGTNTVTLRAVITQKIPGTVDTGDLVATTNESFVFTSQNGTYQLSGLLDTPSTDLAPDITTSPDATITDPAPVQGRLMADGATSNQPQMVLGPDGWPTNNRPPGGGKGFMASAHAVTSTDHTRMANWAKNNVYGQNRGCAPFASFALKDGLRMQFRMGFGAVSTAWLVSHITDPHYWWRMGDYKAGRSRSWTDSQTQSQMLLLNGASQFTEWGWAQPGDLVYYDEHVTDQPWWHFDHTSVVIGRTAKGYVKVAQQNSNGNPITTLNDQWARSWGPGKTGINMVLVRPMYT